MNTVAVVQSNYIPWKGYFDIIHDVDLFIFYDDVQYTKNDWRNRNRIKTPSGPEWLTIPVGKSENRLICEVGLSDNSWSQKHWATLRQNYRRAPFFAEYEVVLEEFYLGRRWASLSELNQQFIQTVARECLGIETRFRDSREYSPIGSKLDRLLDLLRKAGATRYVSGPAAKTYIDAERFLAAGIELVWKSYEGYPEYPQFYPPFVHGVSVLDLLFHKGPSAGEYIWGWRAGS